MIAQYKNTLHKVSRKSFMSVEQRSCTRSYTRRGCQGAYTYTPRRIVRRSERLQAVIIYRCLHRPCRVTVRMCVKQSYKLVLPCLLICLMQEQTLGWRFHQEAETIAMHSETPFALRPDDACSRTSQCSSCATGCLSFDC